MPNVDTVVAAARTGTQGVWKLIWWNILAIAARLVVVVWVAIAALGYYVGVDVAGQVLGGVLGLLVFLGLPVVYGGVQNHRNGGE